MDTKMEAVQESIKLALDAADAATDVTSEYNKVKKAHALLEAKVKQIHKYTTVVFLSSIISGLVVIVVSAFLFMQSSDKLTNMTKRVVGLPKTEIHLAYDKSGNWQTLESDLKIAGSLRYQRINESVGETDAKL